MSAAQNLKFRFLIGVELYDFGIDERKQVLGSYYRLDRLDPTLLTSGDRLATPWQYIATVNYSITQPQLLMLQRPGHRTALHVNQYEKETGLPGPFDTVFGEEEGWYLYRGPTGETYKMVAMRTERSPAEPIRIPQTIYRIEEPTPAVVQPDFEVDPNLKNEPVVVNAEPPFVPHIGIVPRRYHHPADGIVEEGPFDISVMRPVDFTDDDWPIYEWQGQRYIVSVPVASPFLIPLVQFSVVADEGPAVVNPVAQPPDSIEKERVIKLGSILTIAGIIMVLSLSK